MSVHAVCPFYHYEKDKILACECGVMRLASNKAKRDIKNRFCCTFEYGKCKRAKRLLKVYEKGR